MSATQQSTAKQPTAKLLAVLLAMLTAVAPLAIDMYLPAMKVMAGDLRVDIHQVELSISAFLIGYAIGQLVGGPVSDRFGRKPVIFAGLIIFALTSLLLSFADSLQWLLVMRVVQAIGGGIAIVNSSAMIRDLFSGDEAAKVMSMVAMVMMSAPLLAPLLGSQVVYYFGWQSIFTALAVYAVLVMILVIRKLPETHSVKSTERTSTGMRGVLLGYWEVLSHRQAFGFVGAVAFAFSGMFAFITAAPFVYMELYGATERQFPFLFGANIIVMMLMNRINILALERFHAVSILQVGLLIQFMAGCGLLVAALMTAELYWVVFLNMVFVGALGLIAANGTSAALNFFPHRSGTATAVIGVTEFAMGAAVGVVWSILHDGTLGPVAVVMLGCSAVALLCVCKPERTGAP